LPVLTAVPDLGGDGAFRLPFLALADGARPARRPRKLELVPLQLALDILQDGLSVCRVVYVEPLLMAGIVGSQAHE
jgi:hypothetical protein